MDTKNQPNAASWAITVAQASSPQAGWQLFADDLHRLGICNASYVHEAERFSPRLPPEDRCFGHMVSPEWTQAVRTDPILNNIGYKVPAAASVGVGVCVVPDVDMQLQELTDDQRLALGHMKDLGMQGGWTYPVVDRVTNTYSALLIDCNANLAEQQRLVHQHREYLRACAIYIREGLVLQGLTAEAGPTLLSARESDCLAWTAAGKSTKEIASLVGLATSTVNEYITRAQGKLKASNRTQAAARAMLLGAVQL